MMLTFSLSRCSRAAILGSALVLAVTLVAPASVRGQEEPLAEEVFAAAPAEPSWDLTSGYGSVEASRAAIAYASDGLTIQVPGDVRWAPAPAIAPGPSLSASRLLAARRILQGGDLGSMQEEAMAAVIAEGLAWDVTSGYGSVEAGRAARAIAPAPSMAADPGDLAAALAAGTRAESAHLATIPLYDDVPVNSDDRIAAALFGPE